MGLLVSQDGKSVEALRARHLIGRSSNCKLRLNVATVSGEHATLWWVDGGWHIRDLSSRNGTLLNGKRIPSGKSIRLSEGDTLVFGAPQECWILKSAAPPLAQAIDMESMEAVQAMNGEMLALPDTDAPEATVFLSASGQWVMESANTVRPVQDKDRITAGGRTWQLNLPEPITGTIDLDASARSLANIQLLMEHSLDEEHVELSILHNQQVTRLRARSHHYLLLTLARQRLQDASASPKTPISSHGWLYQDELCRMLAIDKNKLNVDVFRIRKQFMGADVEQAANIIERRASTQQLRIGVVKIIIQRL